MLQPTGKSANICHFTHSDRRPITASLSAFHREKGNAFQTCCHWKWRNWLLVAPTARANSSVWAVPCAHTGLKSSLHSAAQFMPFAATPDASKFIRISQMAERRMAGNGPKKAHP
jgi:hypothetical protein